MVIHELVLPRLASYTQPDARSTCKVSMTSPWTLVFISSNDVTHWKLHEHPYCHFCVWLPCSHYQKLCLYVWLQVVQSRYHEDHWSRVCVLSSLPSIWATIKSLLCLITSYTKPVLWKSPLPFRAWALSQLLWTVNRLSYLMSRVIYSHLHEDHYYHAVRRLPFLLFEF